MKAHAYYSCRAAIFALCFAHASASTSATLSGRDFTESSWPGHAYYNDPSEESDPPEDYANQFSEDDSSRTGPNSSPISKQRPNIVIFMADDLGRSDVSFTQGNRQTPTPNIDRFAWDGIILNRHYSNRACTPTRVELLTGKYAFRVGLTTPIAEGEPAGLPLQFPTQANLFKQLGYQTWHVGKWHLGEYQRAYFPGLWQFNSSSSFFYVPITGWIRQRRGFDYSYGLTAGGCNWFNYTIGWITPYPTSGRNLRENGKMIQPNNTNNAYLPELLNAKVEQLIRNVDSGQPFYLYYATPVPHTGYQPYTAVQHTMPQYQLRPPVFQFPDAFPERKKQIGIIQVLDESFKRLTDALTNKGVMNNTIIVFFSDNGAPVTELGFLSRGANHGVNWPLRLGKGTYFEGGIRTAAFIWSPLLWRRGRITEQLFHVTDWWPTLWEAVGGDPRDLPADGDGQSHWRTFQGGIPVGPRRELVININPSAKQYGMIFTDQFGTLYKIISGNVFDNTFFGWNWPEGVPLGDFRWRRYTPAEIRCNYPEGVEITPCRPGLADCLYDLTHDPCETNNIAMKYPAMLELLQQKIRAYNATAAPPVNRPVDPKSDPALWDGWWVPWMDPPGEIMDAKPLTFEPFIPSFAS